nr:hypothetical protein [Peristeroidobacter soli]
MDFEHSRSDKSESATGSDEKLFEIDARIVLAQATHQLEVGGVLVRQHDLQPQQVAPDIAVLHQAGAAGIGGNHPADRRIGAEIDRETKAMRAEPIVQGLQQDPGADTNGTVVNIQIDLVPHALEADDDLIAAVIWRSGCDQTGICSLRDQTQPMLVSPSHDLLNFKRIARADDTRGAA